MFRKLFLVGALALCTSMAVASSGQTVVDGSWEPAGYVQLTSLASATGLGTIPAGARLVLIQAQGDDLRWRDDGTDPTAAIGMVLADGETLVYNGRLSSIKLIQVVGSGVANVSFYR